MDCSGPTYNECKEILSDYLAIKAPKQKDEHTLIVDKILPHQEEQDVLQDTVPEVAMIEGVVCNETVLIVNDHVDVPIHNVMVMDTVADVTKYAKKVFRKHNEKQKDQV